MHSSRIRTVRCSGRHYRGLGVSGQGVSAQEGYLPRGVSARSVGCLPEGVFPRQPPRGQNDRQGYKHYLATTTLGTAISVQCGFQTRSKASIACKRNIYSLVQLTSLHGVDYKSVPGLRNIPSDVWQLLIQLYWCNKDVIAAECY